MGIGHNVRASLSFSLETDKSSIIRSHKRLSPVTLATKNVTKNLSSFRLSWKVQRPTKKLSLKLRSTHFFHCCRIAWVNSRYNVIQSTYGLFSCRTLHSNSGGWQRLANPRHHLDGCLLVTSVADEAYHVKPSPLDEMLNFVHSSLFCLLAFPFALR